MPVRREDAGATSSNYQGHTPSRKIEMPRHSSAVSKSPSVVSVSLKTAHA
jgi:hypothetical protein